MIFIIYMMHTLNNNNNKLIILNVSNWYVVACFSSILNLLTTKEHVQAKKFDEKQRKLIDTFSKILKFKVVCDWFNNHLSSDGPSQLAWGNYKELSRYKLFVIGLTTNYHLISPTYFPSHMSELLKSLLNNSSR